MDSKIPSLQVLRLLESSKLTYVYSCFLCRTFTPEPPPQTHLKLLLYMCVRTDMHMVIRRGDTHVASRRPHLTRVSSQHPVPLTRASTIGPRPTASATPVPCGTLILVPSEVCFGLLVLSKGQANPVHVHTQFPTMVYLTHDHYGHCSSSPQ